MQLREGDWLTPERARVYGAMVAVGLAAMAAWLTWAPMRASVPGGDFISFYAASLMALGGHAGDAWRPDLHQAVEQATLAGFEGYLAFFYPPPYLLLCWPLGLVPFGVALACWNALLVAAMLLALVALLHRPLPARWVVLFALALPATWINLLAGQNGALCTAILAAGFATIDRRPILAGAILGLMVIKPQLAVALPFVLLASGRWPTVLAAATSATAALLLSWLAVGTDGFGAFFGNLVNARSALDAGGVDPALLQSLFGLLQPISPTIAYAAQAILGLAALTLACGVARRARPDGTGLGALAVAATLAATPFLLDYDLLLAALPIGWTLARGNASGFHAWEKLGCLVCAAFPLVTRSLATGLHLQLGPFVALLLLGLVVRRLFADAAVATNPTPAAADGLALHPSDLLSSAAPTERPEHDRDH